MAKRTIFHHQKSSIERKLIGHTNESVTALCPDRVHGGHCVILYLPHYPRLVGPYMLVGDGKQLRIVFRSQVMVRRTF